MLKKLKTLYNTKQKSIIRKLGCIAAHRKALLAIYSNQTHNNLILDLKKKEDQLFLNMSKYHRKNIKKTSNIKNLQFKILNYKNTKNKIQEKFDEFRKYHRISAGRVTRPKETWEIMLKKIYDNEADLFYLTLDDKTISYLYLR